MRPALRKLALTTHVASSVGWFGAVAAFLALAVSGLYSTDSLVARGSYVAMDVVTRVAIWPFCILALITGLIQALGTPWGLFRHYWVLTKLAITLVSTLLLAFHTRPIAYLASIAAAEPLGDDLWRIQRQLAVDAALALGALLFATVLSVYKPWGTTGYGRHRGDRTPVGSQPARVRWLRLLGVLLLVLIAGAVAAHLIGRGFRGH